MIYDCQTFLRPCCTHWEEKLDKKSSLFGNIIIPIMSFLPNFLAIVYFVQMNRMRMICHRNCKSPHYLATKELIEFQISKAEWLFLLGQNKFGHLFEKRDKNGQKWSLPALIHKPDDVKAKFFKNAKCSPSHFCRL